MTHPIDPVPIPLESSCTMRPEPRRRTSGRLARLTMTIVAGCAALLAAGGALAGQERFRYHYVSLDAAVPPGFAFFDPVKIVDDGRVYGTAWTCGSEGCRDSVAVYRNGAMTVLHEGAASDANNAGTVGGDVVLDSDPNHFVTQAALFRAGRVELIPPRPNSSRARSSGLPTRESRSSSRPMLRASSARTISTDPDGKYPWILGEAKSGAHTSMISA